MSPARARRSPSGSTREAREHWLGHARAAAGAGPAWLEGLRTGARDHFADRGLPSTRDEEWRYTSLLPLEKLAPIPARRGHAPIPRASLEALSFPVYACSLYVFVNGFFEPELSTRGPGRVQTLGEADPADSSWAPLGSLVDTKLHPFAALNTALFEDAARVEIEAGANADQPIHLVFVSTGDSATAAAPRVLVRVGAGGRGRVIQDHVSLGAGARFTNAVTEVVLGEDARLDLALLQREDADALHVSQLAARQERDARLRVHTLTLGGGLVRNDLVATLGGPGAECDLEGLFVGTGDQLIDNHTLVDHAVPHGTSRQLYKGILDGDSRGVFRGRVVVRPDAQKTNARQSNPNLLLSDRAEVATKPQLEIHADDVRCSHGSTIGRLDEDALFFLRARGLGEAAARDLLTRGFAAEVLESLGDDALEACVGELLLARLHENTRAREASR